MSRPDKCKWCGEPEKNESLSATRYLCNTQYFRGGTWVRGAQCERDELRKRIADAIDAAQRSIRFALEANSNIRCVFARDMDRVIDILQGNSPEIPEGSAKRESEK